MHLATGVSTNNCPVERLSVRSFRSAWQSQSNLHAIWTQVCAHHLELRRSNFNLQARCHGTLYHKLPLSSFRAEGMFNTNSMNTHHHCLLVATLAICVTNSVAVHENTCTHNRCMAASRNHRNLDMRWLQLG